MCGDLGVSLAGFFETMMGFAGDSQCVLRAHSQYAVVMFFAEIVRRTLYSKQVDEDDAGEKKMPPRP